MSLVDFNTNELHTDRLNIITQALCQNSTPVDSTKV